MLLPSGQRDAAISVPLRGRGHLAVTGEEGQESPLVTLPAAPLPRRRLRGPDLQIARGEKVANECTCCAQRSYKAKWLVLRVIPKFTANQITGFHSIFFLFFFTFSNSKFL